MRILPFLIAMLALACASPPANSPAVCAPASDAAPHACQSTFHGATVPMFHGDRARLGWQATESVLSPQSVALPAFGRLWESEALDPAEIATTTFPARLYASPLYADDVAITSGAYAGSKLSVVFAATTAGWVYAINAFDASCANGCADVAAGTILWRNHIATAAVVPKLDGGIALGVLSTPILDLNANPPRLYVEARDVLKGAQVHALDLGSGALLPGWPVTLDDSTVSPVNLNGPSHMEDATVLSQRGALALSPDGGLLYVPFGAYFDGGVGWLIAVATANGDVAAKPHVAAAFSGAPSKALEANGGMWSAAGVAIDADGHVFATTGNSPVDSENSPNVWGQCLLRWQASLQLDATYTPFNYCLMDVADMDLGGSSPILLPDLSDTGTTTPHLTAFSSKQGTVFLADRDHLPGNISQRPPCSTDSTSDGSLLPPDPQPQFGKRGPLNVFGPYSEQFGNLDYAKMRSTPAWFRDKNGQGLLFVTGTPKAAADSKVTVPPCLVRLKVVTPPKAPAYLAIDKAENTLVLLNPGAPVVSSNGSKDAVVWVLDPNAARTASLVVPNAPHAVLYAIDAITMQPIWHSTPDDLHTGGKYATPVIAHGVVFVGTERVAAFGLHNK